MSLKGRISFGGQKYNKDSPEPVHKHQDKPKQATTSSKLEKEEEESSCSDYFPLNFLLSIVLPAPRILEALSVYKKH